MGRRSPRRIDDPALDRRARTGFGRGWLRSLAVVGAALAAGVGVAALAPAPTGWGGIADAQQTTTLRIATLAPRGSRWMRIFNAWNGSVRQESGGKLQLRFYPGGVSGDESDTINKIRAGQLDGAAVTATGLGLIVRPVLVLQLPDLFNDYQQLDRVRDRLSSEWATQFESNGYKLLGWGDVGRGRIFSKNPVRKPADLRSMKPWAWRDDPIFNEFYRIARANPVRLGVPEVYPGLQSGIVDAAPGSALAVLNLQWFTKLSYMTDPPNTVLIGATVLKKSKYDALPANLRDILDRTSARAHAALKTQIRRDDQAAFQTLKQRGLTVIDTTPHASDWQQVAQQTRQRLTGRLFPASLLQRVKRIANGP